jgi:hypothetical protein
MKVHSPYVVSQIKSLGPFEKWGFERRREDISVQAILFK